MAVNVERPTTELDMFTVEAIRDMIAFDGHLRELAPAVYMPAYDIWVMGRHDDIHAAARDWEAFSSTSRPFHDPSSVRPEILLTDDPPQHTRVRAVIQRALSPVVMKRMREDFAAGAEAVVDEVLAAGGGGPVEVNAHSDLVARFVLKVFPDALGLPDEGRENLLRFADAAFNTFGPPNDIQRHGLELGIDAINWVEEHCRQEMVRPDGIAGTMYAAMEAGEITRQEADLLVKTLLAAGADTTILASGNLMKAFVDFPDQWELLRADPGLARGAFDEVLRYECPARFGGRITTRTVDVGGVEVPAGARIALLWLAGGRDPRRWEDADVLDIRRKVVGHVGLGFGIHACVGQSLARAEGEALFSALARRVERIELIGEPEAAINMSVHGFDHLPMRLHPA